MANVYPIKVTINAKGERFPHKFAEEAAAVLEKTDRLSFEITKEGLASGVQIGPLLYN